MPEILIVIPVLGRPHRAQAVYDSAIEATDVPHRVLFVTSPGDRKQRHACEQTGADVLEVPRRPGRGDWAMKIEAAIKQSDERWIFTGADDLLFHEGWGSAALSVGYLSEAGVVGTNDLGNPRVKAGKHSTHSLVRRSYVEERGTIDGPGLFHLGYSHNFCNPPEAPIWMADLSFRPLGEVRVGDEVIGWERVPAGQFTLNRLRSAQVLAVTERRAPLVRVEFASGRSLCCTPDHRWLRATWSPRSGERGESEWITPKIGSSLLRVVDEPQAVPSEHERLAGWLAGIYDGEGSGVYVASQSIEKNPDVYAAISAALRTLEIPHTTPNGWKVGMFCLTGGRQGFLDFLARIQPVKRERLTRRILGGRRFGQRDKIIAVEPAGEGPVFSMTTTTGNYVAWGYASKNCDTEMVETAKARGEWVFAHQAIVEHLHPDWRKAKPDATYALGKQNFIRDAQLYRRRQKLWTKASRSRS